MPPIESTATPLGSACPDFRLPSVGSAGTGQIVSRSDFSPATALVVMFICNHCPYVRAVEDRLIALVRRFEGQGVKWVGICSNDAESYPDDAPAKLAARAQEKNYGFAYLYDESQQVARAFGAVCTPDIFVYDAQGRLAYRGRIDDNWKVPEAVTQHELADALVAIVAENPAPAVQRPTIGCSIKWKA